MEPRVSLVTLGVADLDRSRRFYEALGWRSDSKPEDGVVFFQSGGMVFGLCEEGDITLPGPATAE
jgi:catechol 2,3-dioxygenase-like lactoylglutathione lyase family enzyme